MKRRTLIGLVAMLPLARSAIAATGSDDARRLALTTSDGRTLDVWSWFPRSPAAGTILFSHGFASAPRHYLRMIPDWVAAGYIVHAPLHLDSTDHPAHSTLQGMAGWASRIHDMRALSALHRCEYVAIGHSFGALTALVMGGTSALVPNGVAGPLRDPGARCVVALSPPGPIPPLIDAAGYADLAVPALIQTGTRDVPRSDSSPDAWRDHLAAFTAGPGSGNRHGLVLEGVDHYFGGLICDPTKTGPDQSVALKATTQSSLRFLDSYGPSGSGREPAFAGSQTARFYRR